jgi:hypothetical protein
MNKLTTEDIEQAKLTSSLAINLLGEIQYKVRAMRKRIDLPDYSELQEGIDAETAKLGYKIEDAETAMANISQEISDAINAFDSIIELLNKKQN